MQNARLFIDCHAVDGLVSTYTSSYRFAIVPKMNMHYAEGGWQTRAQVWPDTIIPITQIFGAGATGMVPGNGGAWTEAEDFLHGIPYWIHSNDITFFSSIAPINPIETSYPLLTGWNFISNPHLIEYPLYSIRFLIIGNIFRYSEMINQKLISRAVFVYREGKYQAVDNVLPYESFFIKYYGSALLTTQINFYPYFSAPEITPPPSDWYFKVQVTNANLDSDEFVLGVNPAAKDDYDFVYDLPSAPPKPFPSIRSYLIREAPEDVNFTDSKLYSEFRAPLDNIPQAEKIWQFKLSTGTTDPIDFNLSSIDLPDLYTIRIYIGDHGYTFGETTNFTFVPSAPGTYIGTIKVNNYPVANTDLLQSPISQLSVYPNPFNPSTTIAFNTPVKQDVSVDVYNLKGQKVRTIHSGLLDGGNHQLVWDGKDGNGRTTSSGIYFAMVKTAHKRQTIKMIMMK